MTAPIERIRYLVTAHDIAHGTRGNCATCPHARAFTRAIRKLPGFSKHIMRVGGFRAWAYPSNDLEPYSHAFKISQEAISWIGKYDSAQPVNPGWFTATLD